jgi:lipoprotein-anchoring transpeptidase ErfK/SrfK
MRKSAWLLALAATLLGVPAGASSILARIDLSEQRMQVFIDGFPRYSWAVSTARPGYRTPVGQFRAQRLEAVWFSRKYDNSPMPHSIFFSGGFAIHGTEYVKRLGTPASHGCVPDNAATLFSLVRENGGGSTEIVVSQ